MGGDTQLRHRLFSPKLGGLWLLYEAYERRLLSEIRRGPLPRHLGVSLDGNRRHARSVGLSDHETIYRLGAQKLDELLDWCAELAIPVEAPFVPPGLAALYGDDWAPLSLAPLS